ncbi:L-type lectin-domain containing receptor kinase SIT2-like [Oryza brachyantha]|uniref:non-specific serine/threonine protein kinase n=1 Tax=Oryza brachyantha TaxID=4533 RepID=J3MW07_ORYBR|nr:L-type lectin-domain containing receptor kinase SIT2-like [Oryza brachyantha]
MERHPFLLLLVVSLGLTLVALCAGQNQFIYHGFTGENLTIDGTAKITPEGLLELTSDKNDLSGHAFFPTPMHLRRPPNSTVQSFSVNFVFGIQSFYSDRSYDGMAFLLAPTNDLSAAWPDGYLGLFNISNRGNFSNHIFAVELDTFQNSEFGDISNSHVGVDVNDVRSVQSSFAGFYDEKGVFRNLTLYSGRAMQVWLEYVEEATQITVTMAPIDTPKPKRPLLSATYDLSTVLTDPVYIGFSAATGPVSTRHIVLGWSFDMGVPAPALDITKLPKLPRVGTKPRSNVLEIVLPIASAMFIIILGTIAILFVRRKLRYAELREDWEVEFGPQRFSYKDLFHATLGFKNKNLIGVGGFGKVYKGILATSKLDIAVKKISHESRQGMKEFITEVVSIGRLRHRNLVPLLGYCRRKNELLLVYNYMSNGSLDKYLHDVDGRSTLDWTRRFQIIKDVARGLLYLHEKWEKVVIHRDIKASNVLLDDEMNGRLGDFGLARLYDHGTNPQTTHVVGTMGYLAPEMVRTGKASPLTDVFAFGAFLLEVTCGQRPVKQDTQGKQLMLVDWVLEHWHHGLLTEAVDMRLQGDYNIDEAYLVLKLALVCLHPFPTSRPSMREVVQYLDNDLPPPELAPTRLGFSKLPLMQNKGFNPSVMSYPELITSFGTFSGLSGGR